MLNASARLIHRWISPLINLRQLPHTLRGYLQYLKSWRTYQKMPNAEGISLIDSYPMIYDGLPTTPFDPHYFYQGVWAFKKIYGSGTQNHVDVGSQLTLVGILTSITHVTFIDLRLLQTDLSNITVKQGDILTMPFAENTIHSLSCLHVAEHVGLGRYGDALNPLGTKQACAELARVLAPKGNLYFSLPLGRPRVCFNAHRIHAPTQILDYFSVLRLVEFSAVDDAGHFHENVDPFILNGADYGCGFFHFTK